MSFAAARYCRNPMRISVICCMDLCRPAAARKRVSAVNDANCETRPVCLVCRRRIGPALRLLDESLCEDCVEIATAAAVGDEAYDFLIWHLRAVWQNGLARPAAADGR